MRLIRPRSSEPSESQIRATEVVSARADLGVFIALMHREMTGELWDAQPWHDKLIDFLMRVYRHEITRGMVNTPPRSGKTEVTTMFEAWTLGRHPDSAYILASYTADLAERNSAQLQRIVQSEVYRRIFPRVAIAQDTSARDSWRTVWGGEIRAIGATGSVVGFGAGKDRGGDDHNTWGGCIVIDDPHKLQEIRSQVSRDSVFDFYVGSVRSRRNVPHTPILIIAQRGHQDDLCGRLLSGASGDEFELLSIPALGEDGKSFWPRKFPEAELAALRDARPWEYWTMYQQAPFDPAGQIFKVDSMPIVDETPGRVVRRVRAWDLAGTVDRPGADPDWTVGLLLARYRPAVGDGDRYVIEDIVRLRAPPDGVRAAILSAARRDGPTVRVVIEEQPGAAGKDQIASLERMLREHQRVLEPVRATGTKFTRAEPAAAALNVANISALRRSWLAALVDELRAFDSGRHDDQVDALAMAFANLSGKGTGIRISAEALALAGQRVTA
jgi:predicted phage terminase large subunit-like protein